MWIWNTKEVLPNPIVRANLLDSAKKTDLTDLYLCVGAQDYATYANLLGVFIGAASQAGMSVWALDGARSFFDDADGPQAYYEGIKNLIIYNNRVPSSQRFVGLQGDNEPQDAEGHIAFHNELQDSELNCEAGSGVWQSTQAADREMLLRGWLRTNETARTMLHAAGLQYAIAAPSWTSAYFGSALRVTFPTAESPKRPLTELLLEGVDEYVIMTYNCDPLNAANRALVQVQLASELSCAPRPRVFAAVEVTPGYGVNVSYADTPGKASKAQVLRDMQIITNTLQHYPAFAGISIEQWSSWDTLSP